MWLGDCLLRTPENTVPRGVLGAVGAWPSLLSSVALSLRAELLEVIIVTQPWSFCCEWSRLQSRTPVPQAGGRW